jgi:L,D-peptidoglycan transpeptidase YkuD (ErfK/YbiS/YcfS/YnhG family)
MDENPQISRELTAYSPLAASRQLLVVQAPAWPSTAGGLQRFVRADKAADWLPVGGSIEVSIGRCGLAWGIGLHGAVNRDGPRKREGDGCAPAGVFAITELFGQAGRESPFARAARLPYRPATTDLKCVDDPASAHYNQFVNLAQTPMRDWTSHEDMRRDDQRYAVGAVIAHNSPNPVPGAGSCIFLHVWQAAGVPTAGCTAGALADITEICSWLDAAAAPLLVQLPAAEYAHFREAWALP